jgi:hypothetical protein
MRGVLTKRIFAIMAAGACLSGCSSLLTQGAGAGAGVGGAAISNAVTRNGAITAGIGLGVQAAAIAGVQALEKTVHGAEQNAIATAAGPVPRGGVARWQVHHQIPIEDDEHGELTVVDDFAPGISSGAAPAFDCKQIIFSVDTKTRRNFYTTFVCSDSGRWTWAAAEPATARWGSLQ